MVNGYKNLETTLVELADRTLYEYNAKAKNAILCGLANIAFTKVMQYTSSNYILEKMKNIYEKDKKVKKVNMQTF